MVPEGHHSDSEESDADSVEEVHVTRFLNKGLLQGLQQAKACSAVKGGIKRHPGHYHLRDRTHAVMRTRMNAYDGKHWDVSATNRLQRSTHRLTVYAIQKEVAREQLRRAKSEKEDKLTVAKLFHPINTEYWDRIEMGAEEERKLSTKEHNEIATVKDEALCELMRRKNTETVEEELEIERERQVAMVEILNGMKDSIHKSSSLEEMVFGIAETNHRKSIVQQDLAEAFARYVDEEQEVDSEYRGAMMEMMDESLNNLQHMFKREQHKHLVKQEQIRRMEEWEEHTHDRNFLKSQNTLHGVLGDLQSAFNLVETKEILDSSKEEQDLSDRKELVLQELRRSYARRWAERVSAIERKRRILDEEAALYYDDPNRESMLRLIARVQRQMILQKFAGNWINLAGITRKNNEISEYDVENDHDKKLRAMRMKSRRQSCVISGIDS